MAGAEVTCGTGPLLHLDGLLAAQVEAVPPSQTARAGPRLGRRRRPAYAFEGPMLSIAVLRQENLP